MRLKLLWSLQLVGISRFASYGRPNVFSHPLRGHGIRRRFFSSFGLGVERDDLLLLPPLAADGLLSSAPRPRPIQLSDDGPSNGKKSSAVLIPLFPLSVYSGVAGGKVEFRFGGVRTGACMKLGIFAVFSNL